MRPIAPQKSPVEFSDIIVGLSEFHRIEMSLCCLGGITPLTCPPPTRPENWQDNRKFNWTYIFVLGGESFGSLVKQLKGPNNNMRFMWPNRQNYMVKLLLGLYMMSGKFWCVFVMAPNWRISGILLVAGIELVFIRVINGKFLIKQ